MTGTATTAAGCCKGTKRKGATELLLMWFMLLGGAPVRTGTLTDAGVALAASFISWPVELDDGMGAGTLRHLMSHFMMRALRSMMDGSPIPG